GDAARVGSLLANDLQAPALSLRPDLAAVLDRGGRPPAIGRLLSGSGPTCLFLAADRAGAVQVCDGLRDTGVDALVARGPAPGAHVVPVL
ncbi:MAG TPA: 4-(cytidine 5'-diphospho)-2-C-methyl-D-erythritol kinase, partial [Nocardioidaceae bacterium]|nr:4-(cytidine 5'-diphospho)-2-C-methyl-D-erythritol kinase [Nocardioidaceae bacterium]